MVSPELPQVCFIISALVVPYFVCNVVLLWEEVLVYLSVLFWQSGQILAPQKVKCLHNHEDIFQIFFYTLLSMITDSIGWAVISHFEGMNCILQVVFCLRNPLTGNFY